MPGVACSVASCKSSYYNKAKQDREDLMFFRFPKDREIQKEWLKRCYRQDKIINPRNRRICSDHFNPNDFEDEVRAKLMGCRPKRLKKDAIPSLLLLTPEEYTPLKDSQRTRRYLQKDNIAIVEDPIHNLTSAKQTPIEPSHDSLQPLEENCNSYTPFCIENIEIFQVASSSKESDLDILKRKIDELQDENTMLKEKMFKKENNEKNLTSQINSLEQQLIKNNESKLKEEAQVASDNEGDQIIMPGCAAVGCPNSAKKGFIMKRFPKDPKRRQEWADRLKRDKWSPTDWSTLCEVHFSPEMWEKVREDGGKKLKHDAVPTIFNTIKTGLKRKLSYENELQSPHSSCKLESSESVEIIKFETNSPVAGIPLLEIEPKLRNTNESIRNSPELIREESEPLNNDSEFSNNLILEPNESPNTVCRVCLEPNGNTISLLQLNPDDGRNINALFQEILGETIEQVYDLKVPQQICESCLFHLGHAYKFKKSYEKTLQTQNSILKESDKDDSVDNSTLCRICLDPDAELPFALELTLDDESTLDVVQVFQELTGETGEQIFDSTTPQRICDKCPDSLVYAYQFKEALKNSTQILRNSLLNTDSISETADLASEDVDEKLDGYNENLSETVDNFTNKEIENDNDALEDEYTEVLSETEDNLTNKEIENELNKIEEKQIKLHNCPICFEKFSALELKQHCKSHDTLKKYFMMAPLFKKKIRFYTKPKNNICLFYRDTVLHTCPFCLNAFSGKDLRNHIQTHKADGHFKCKECDRIFLGRNHLKRHQLTHRKETPFECEMCGKGFFLKKNFEFHQFHHSIPLKLPFQCKHCSKAFANPEHLKRHNFTHERSMSYRKYYTNKQNVPTCKQCRQKFKTEEELEEHKCTIICTKCLKPFANRKQLTNHGCEVERLQFICACGKEFKTLLACNEHACKIKKKSSCSICGKYFTNLKQHLQSHDRVKKEDYSCDTCGKTFLHKESVWRHKIAVHRPPQIFSCQYCEKQFKNKIYMKNHEKIHTRKKEHICEICGLKFLYKVYLDRHQKVHKNTTESEEESLVVFEDF